MKLTIDSNASTGRFAVMVEGERLVFETYRLNPEDRASLANALRYMEERIFSEGFQSATRQMTQFVGRLK